MRYESPKIPRAFLQKRFHTLLGLWLVLFLVMHLFTNFQAALGVDGKGFIDAVNAIHDLPFLPVIEIVALGVPFVLHGWWGIQYARRARMNSFSSDGSSPSLTDYQENQGYSWQRITAWVLAVGIILHVLHMRILEYPAEANLGGEKVYLVRVMDDPGLSSVASRLGVTLYSQEEMPQFTLSTGEVVAGANNFGTVELLIVRDSFKQPWLMVLYSLFVLSAAFHAFQGLWTSMISLGVTVTLRSQRWWRIVSYAAMLVVAIFGLVAIWGTYWLNLKN